MKNEWQTIAKGTWLKHVDWSGDKPKRTLAVDPYMIWADITSVRSSESMKDGVGLLVEFPSRPVNLNQLPDLGVGHEAWLSGAQAHLKIFSCRCKPEQLVTLLRTQLGRQIERIELSRVRSADSDGGKISPHILWSSVPVTLSSRVWAKQLPPKGKAPCKPLICVVDDRCNFASASLGRCVHSIWHQGDDEKTKKLLKERGWERALLGADGMRMGPNQDGGRIGNPQRFRGSATGMYRRTDGQVDAQAETDVYREFGYMDRTHRWGHGAAVLSVLAAKRLWLGGRPRWWHGDRAADIRFVQLPVPTVLDTSGGALSTHVLDAVMHAIEGAKTGQPVIVNISYGTHGGPHDGTSLFERSLRQLLDLYDGQEKFGPWDAQNSKGKINRGIVLHVIVSAGNAHRLRCHASKLLTAADPKMVLRWKLLPDDTTDNFVEIWLPEGAEVEVCVTPPGGQASPRVGAGQSLQWKEGGELRAAVIYRRKVTQGENGTMVLLAVSPTRGEGAVAGVIASNSSVVINSQTNQPRPAMRAPHGVWTIVVHLKVAVGGAAYVHAWVQRGDSAPGRGREARGYVGRQSYLVDDGSGLVNPRVTLNGIGTLKHDRLFAVGAMRFSDMSVSAYSAAGPNCPGSNDRFEGPDVVTVGDDSIANPGLLVSGVYAGARVRVSGTSIAAPLFARLLSEHLSEGHTAASMAPTWSACRKPSHVVRRTEGSPEEADTVHRGDYVRLVPTGPDGHMIKPPSKK